MPLINHLEDNKIYCPDDLGAVGDGITIDDKAFLIGNYIYLLKEGRTYRITEKKLMDIHNTPVIGKGVIRFEKEKDTTKFHGNDVFEISAESPKNRLLECVNRYSDELSFNTDSVYKYNRYIKRQGRKLPSSTWSGYYHNIGAIYLDYDKVDRLPNQFTVCIGRSVVFSRTPNTNKWIKTIDETIPLSGVKNYRLPWGGSLGDEGRSFTHTPKIVNDHVELIVEKRELTSWIGKKTKGDAGCIHFWTRNYNFNAGEYDELISYWEIWVKEPEASGCLLFSSGIDTLAHDVGVSTKTQFQEIISTQIPITISPTSFWSCSMNYDVAKTVNFEDLVGQMSLTSLGIPGDGRNLNILGVQEFNLTLDNYRITHDINDIYEFSIEGTPSGSYKAFNFPLLENIKIKAGEPFVFYIQILEGIWNWKQATIKYNPSANAIPIDSKGIDCGNGIRAVKIIPTHDVTTIRYQTNTTEVYYSKFRLWITKGSNIYDYQKYGTIPKGLVFNEQIVDKYLEEKIADLNSRIVVLETNATS